MNTSFYTRFIYAHYGLNFLEIKPPTSGAPNEQEGERVMVKLDAVDQEELDRVLLTIKNILKEAEEVEFEDFVHVVISLQLYNELHDGFKELKRLLKQEGLLK